MNNISYRGKSYNAALLLAIAGQGVVIEVDRDQIEAVADCVMSDTGKGKPVIVVAKNGDRYDMLAASFDKLVDPNGLKIEGKMKVVLLSKHVLAKAEVAAVQERLRSAAQSEREAIANQYDQRQARYGFQESRPRYSDRRFGRDRFA